MGKPYSRSTSKDHFTRIYRSPKVTRTLFHALNQHRWWCILYPWVEFLEEHLQVGIVFSGYVQRLFYANLRRLSVESLRKTYQYINVEVDRSVIGFRVWYTRQATNSDVFHARFHWPFQSVPNISVISYSPSIVNDRFDKRIRNGSYRDKSTIRVARLYRGCICYRNWQRISQ